MTGVQTCALPIYRVDADVFAGQAGEKQLAPVLALEERAEDVRNLESALVIYAGLLVASKHTESLTCGPLFATIFHSDIKVDLLVCQSQNPATSASYAKISPFNRPLTEP